MDVHLASKGSTHEPTSSQHLRLRDLRVRGTLQGVLHGILGVIDGAEHPVAMDQQLATERVRELVEDGRRPADQIDRD
jgi:hypothetical protein